MVALLHEQKTVRLFTAQEARELDQLAIKQFGQAGIRLMHRAGQAVFEVLQRHAPSLKSISVYCGKGNNGGDGYIVAGLAALRGYAVEVFCVEPESLVDDAADARAWCLEQPNISERPASAAPPTGALIVDALLGTGIKGEVRPVYAQAIEAINLAGKPVISIDLPSGLNATTGTFSEHVVRADHTVTFVGVKRGLVTGQGQATAGLLHFDDLGIPAAAYEQGPVGIPWLCWNDMSPLPVRPKAAHKGSFGHALLIGGAPGYGGAVMLSAQAALRAGVGLLSVATCKEHVTAMLSRHPEAMVRSCESRAALAPLLASADVIACGPGLGIESWGEQMFETALATEKPLILDADGLNLLARRKKPLHRTSPLIVTPHPGEAARLLQVEIAEIESDRCAAATKLGRLLNAWVVLKGSGSVLATPEGSLLGICRHGNPGMASGGTGDVLTGLILGLWSHLQSPQLALKMAVCAHSLAADNLVGRQGELGMLASDMPPEIRSILNG